MAISPELELVWDGGSLNLLGWNETVFGEVEVQALGEGTDWGNPQSIRRTLLRAMSDGSAEVTDGYSNRTVTIKLQLSSKIPQALAAGEGRLHLMESKRRAELRWTPPTAGATPSAYIIVVSDLVHEMADLEESDGSRYYTLTLTCLPFVRSINPVVIEALPPFIGFPALVTGSDYGTWAGANVDFNLGDYTEVISAYPASPGAEGEYVDYEVIHTIYDISVLPYTKPYLAIQGFNVPDKVWYSNSTAGEFVPLVLAGRESLAGADENEEWTFFQAPIGIVSRFKFVTRGPIQAGHVVFGVVEFSETDTPALTSGHQALRAIPTPGSARADGSLLVQSRDATTTGTGTPLGHVLVYTGPQYDPRLSKGRIGTPAVVPASLSGGSITGTEHTFIRPADAFPDGSYGLWAHVDGPAGALDWTLELSAVHPISGAHIADLDSVDLTCVLTGTDYELVNLGNIDLPGLASVRGGRVSVKMVLTAAASVALGELLAFNRTLGSLTVVDTRAMSSIVESPPGIYTATAGVTRVRIESASLQQPVEQVSAGRSGLDSLPISLASELLSWDGVHLFTPDTTYLYVGSTGAVEPKVTGEFRPASHTHMYE